jgi:hypothetical protein
MADYKLTKVGARKIANTGNGVLDIPNDERNRHWREFQRWLADGNIPDPLDPDPPPITDLDIANASFVRDPAIRALLKVLAVRFGVPLGTLIAELRAQV